MKYTRRELIKFGSYALFAAGTIPVLAKNTIGQELFSPTINTFSDPLLFQNANSFQKLVGSEFIFYKNNSAVYAVLSEVKTSKTVKNNSGECFSLVFEMPSDDFEQETYDLFQQSIGKFNLLSVPGKSENGKTLLIAVINRI